MAEGRHIENPFEYALEKTSWALRDTGRMLGAERRPRTAAAPTVNRITAADLRAALREGMADLGAARADIVFIGVIYPLAGLLLLQVAANRNLLPLAFPLVSGFALLGPLAAVGLYEISRRRERGEPASWRDAAGVLSSPALGSILGMGLILLALFGVWLAAAWAIYNATLGPEPPASAGAFLSDVFSTPAGWTMIVVGCAVGAVFAAVALAVSIVTIPLLLDRDISLLRAIGVSLKAVRENPTTLAMWGLIVASALVLGSVPVLVGLIVVMPLLGHATWRLYRRLVSS
ncbi:DUF2189 domain-containing protein [Phenylobacterium deserti]|uniref:DUF2189 domain-containing protein n=1 Tax=Phenylobacterium deserti TaxID=1914756 RepID=A0A328AV37_9CAUL|nr:DUF2189 domain-containing protein [Phenylobacterium deserti]RAK58075.1 hypothetical protein DJ018_09255 [Phenylobacterium deserti]